MSHTPSVSSSIFSRFKGSSAIVPPACLVRSPEREAASATESEVAAGAGTAAESAVAARRLGLAAGLAVAVDAGIEKLESGGTERGVAASRTVVETTVEAFRWVRGGMSVEPEKLS